MRSDMDKILVERPRKGGHGTRKGRLPRDGEPLPRFLGVRRQIKERGDFKSLNENLAPLRRYLERQVNRPWNKVYGEMRAHIDAGNTVQAHVLTHVDLYIHRTVVKVAPSRSRPCGLEYQGPSWFGAFRRVDEGELYVDPDDGIIKRARRRCAAAPRRARSGRETLPLKGGELGILLNGVWYALTLRNVEVVHVDDAGRRGAPMLSIDGDRLPVWRDPVLGLIWSHERAKLEDAQKLYGSGKLAFRKPQLSSRELAANGLVNQPQPPTLVVHTRLAT